MGARSEDLGVSRRLCSNCMISRLDMGTSISTIFVPANGLVFIDIEDCTLGPFDKDDE